MGAPPANRGHVGERSVGTISSRRSRKRLARRQLVALALAASLLLVVTAGALAVTGDLTQPAGNAGCISETEPGRASTAAGSTSRTGVAVSPDGKSVYVTAIEATPWSASTATRPPGRSDSPPGTPAASVRPEPGLASTAMGSTTRTGGREPGRKERLRRLGFHRRGGAPQSQHDHRGDHPARRDAPAASARRGGAVRRRPRDRRPEAVEVSPDGKSVYVAARARPTTIGAVARLDRNPTTGAITQPAGTAGCVSEPGIGDHAPTAVCSPAARRGGEPGRKERLRRAGQLRRGAFDRNATTGAITQPAGTAGCVSEGKPGPAPTATGLTPRYRWR